MTGFINLATFNCTDVEADIRSWQKHYLEKTNPLSPRHKLSGDILVVSFTDDTDKKCISYLVYRNRCSSSVRLNFPVRLGLERRTATSDMTNRDSNILLLLLIKPAFYYRISTYNFRELIKINLVAKTSFIQLFVYLWSTCMYVYVYL